MSLKQIGTVSNYADEESLKILALWKESISAIKLSQPISASSLFYDEYSHYIVVHDPIDIEFSEKRNEWNKRFTKDAGVSVVEFIKSEWNTIYVRGLFALNGSMVYGIVPYTAFDSKDARFPAAEMENVRNAVMEKVLPQIKGKTIVDIGCGIGIITIDIARRNLDSEVYGIEINDGLTKQCEMNSKLFQTTNVKFKTGNIYDLPFGDNSVDTATCFFMLHHLDDIPRALAEVKRMLREGGKIKAVDPIGHHHGPDMAASEWQKLFEEAGYSVDVKIIAGAVVSSAILLKNRI
ncbi:MAG: class I SAM-dependent methyltransferase [Methanosarcinaceae archaeon]|nr:class I SAM-dependent methyltransferase [Methanosarcinaceae archaeon]